MLVQHKRELFFEYSWLLLSILVPAQDTFLQRRFYISSLWQLVLDEASGSIYVEDDNLAVLNPGLGLESEFDGDGSEYSL